MPPRHAIEQALDLARIPALARTAAVPPIPANVVELMRVAAASPQACDAAVAATGESREVLIEAARFYLQQMLFRPDADSYRILGIEPGASRATARRHMHWLLQWLHPDRQGGWDGAYADRVLKAWREVSASAELAHPPHANNNGYAAAKNGTAAAIRLPWIKRPLRRKHGGRSRAPSALWALPAGSIILLLALAYYFGPGKSIATIAALWEF